MDAANILKPNDAKASGIGLYDIYGYLVLALFFLYLFFCW